MARNADGLFLFPQKIQEYIYYINGYIRAYRLYKEYKDVLQIGVKVQCSLKYKINTMDYFGNVLELVQLKRVTAIK